MKNKKFVKFSILGLLLGAVSLVGLSDVSKNITQVNSYTKDGTLATTIKLKDNSAEEIKNYYSALNGKDASELQGNNLLKNLKPILQNGQKYYKYDGDSLWALYEIIDRDWDKSPASEISGYDKETNTITGYRYGSSTSSKGTNPYIHALYVDRSVDNQTRAWDDHQQTQWGINQEHIWPKSQGFNAGGAGGARGDPMHLWAGNGRVNGTEHNNNMYGFVDKSKTYTNPYEKLGYKNLKDNYSGKSLTMPSSNDTVFEPQDSDKGDIARAIFYMVARYNNIAGNDSTINQDNPNLALRQTTQSLTSYTTTSSNKQTGYMGLMTDLLYWNHLDPVDEFEIHRNNLLFNNYTFNRNPFIDYPEWADYIWGKPVYDGRNYVSYSSSPTGSVDLSTDVINGFKGAQPQQVTVSSIEVTKKPTKLVYNVGETLDTSGMVVKAHMSNNTTRTLSTGDYTVSPSGALKASDNLVTVTYEGKTDSFAIAVKSSGGGGTTEESKNIVLNRIGTSLGSTANTTLSTVSVDNSEIVGDKFDLNYYQCKKQNDAIFITKSVDGFISNKTPVPGDIESVTIHINSGASGKTTYFCSFSTSECSSVYVEANSTAVNIVGGASSEFTCSVEGARYFCISLGNANNGQVSGIDIKYKSGSGGGTNTNVESISLDKDNVSLEIGASEVLTPTISPSNATVQLVSWSSSDSSIVDVNDEGEITAVSAGSATITCSALDGSGVTATCEVTVNAPVTLTSITLSGEYPTEFYLGDQFSSEGLIVTANYSNNTHVDVTDDVEITGYDMESETIQTVTVSYGDISATYSIEVKEKALAENEILIVASQQGLVNADDLGTYTDGIASVTFIKNNGTQPKYYSSTSAFRLYCKNTFTIVGTKTIQKIEFEMTKADGNGTSTITANVGNFDGTVWTGESNNITFTIGGESGQRNIVSIKITYDLAGEDIVTLQSITLSGTYKTEYFVGDTFTSEGLVVTAHYSDGTSKEVTPTSVSSPTMSTANDKTITVSYTEDSITREATYTISVTAVATEYITLSGNYRTEFIQGEEYDPSGLRITEHKNNGTTSAAHLPTSQGCTITGYDKDKLGEQTITVDWNGVNTTYRVNVVARPSVKVTEEGAAGYYLVEDDSTLRAGDKLLIVGIESNAYYALAPYDTGNNCKRNEIPAPENDYFQSNVAYLTLGGAKDNWTLYDGSKYLYAAGGTGSNNYLKGTASATNANAQWSISISAGCANIETADTTVARNTIRHNTGSDLFSCYSAGGQSDIYLYRYETRTTTINYVASVDLTKALISAQEVLDAACDAKNVTRTNWNKVKNLITPFLVDATSDDYKGLIFGEAVSAEVNGNLFQDFLARYDLIVSTYNYEKFIKDSTNADIVRASHKAHTINTLSFDNDATIMLIIIVAGVVALGGFILLKKRKEN